MKLLIKFVRTSSHTVCRDKTLIGDGTIVKEKQQLKKIVKINKQILDLKTYVRHFVTLLNV